MYSEVERRLYFRIWSPAREYLPSWHRRGIDEGASWIVAPGTKKAHYMYGDPGDQRKRVLIVEGIVDQLRVGIGCVSLLGCAMSATHEAYLSQFEEVWVGMDEDRPGREAEEEIVSRLQMAGVPVVRGLCLSQELGDWRPTDKRLKTLQGLLRAGVGKVVA